MSVEWRRYSKARLRKRKWCEGCKGKGQDTLATETDHIVPYGNDIKLFWDKSNHQSLCKSCHSRKTVQENHGFGRAPKPQL